MCADNVSESGAMGPVKELESPVGLLLPPVLWARAHVREDVLPSRLDPDHLRGADEGLEDLVVAVQAPVAPARPVEKNMIIRI